jgi:hypothetical protein
MYGVKEEAHIQSDHLRIKNFKICDSISSYL